MARVTGNSIGEMVQDNLIASTFPPAEAFTIDLKTSGVIERGTVMTLESDGKYEVIGKGSGDASCVLAETTEEDDVVGVAYRTGHFYRNGIKVGTVTKTTGEGDSAVTTEEEYELTAEDENNLRLAGILLSDGL